ncbi:MAG: rRNA maturation RNase YbeY [Candidatus Marinimicrobia bacterium]|nr:rRNA maturation RNase YbeY [Candidatus Neomarinimicrobiota bacterium]MBL7022901.1 rRNA maturation RNase YbeY [Candidatus Neomarinimicrobiota bacterium]MBL7109220.1 rRNA maturation RNase YbeY [Candidatus Neomarinimicrobiota bacterium]
MINVQIINEADENVTINQLAIESCCRIILTDKNHQNGEITIIFTGDEELRKLKKKYFNLDVYTDVISFNLEDENSDIEGEIYISWDRAEDNAKKYGENFQQELKRLVIHGVLHLTGEEDENTESKKKMNELENIYLNKIKDSIIN